MLWLIERTALFFPVLLAGLSLVVELGLRVRRASPSDDAERQSLIESARDGLRVLLSLMLGFSLPMSLAHYENRSQLVIDEANAISAVEQRAETLREPFHGAILQSLRDYVDARVAFGNAGPDESKMLSETNLALHLDNEMLQQAVMLVRQGPDATTPLFVQAVGGLSDLIQQRLAAEQRRIPSPIWTMFILISALSCFVVGYSMRHRLLLTMLVWPLSVAIVLAMVAELDNSRTGLVRVNQQSIHRIQLDLKAKTDSSR